MKFYKIAKIVLTVFVVLTLALVGYLMYSGDSQLCMFSMLCCIFTLNVLIFIKTDELSYANEDAISRGYERILVAEKEWQRYLDEYGKSDEDEDHNEMCGRCD